MIADDINFKSKLDHRSREKAREELGESEKDRLGAVQSFRSLVQQQPWLRTPTGMVLYIGRGRRCNLRIIQ